MKILGTLCAILFVASVSLAHAGGARLHHVGPNSVYAKVGLESGDIIDSVDDEPVTSTGHAAALIYGKAGDGQQHTIQIRRNGERLELTFPE